MARSRPTRIDDRGDAWRVTTVATYFIVELCLDSRVKEAYALWRTQRALLKARADRELDDLLERTGPGDEQVVQAWIDDWWRPHDARDRAVLERFVSEVLLHLNMPWVADCLLHVFSNVWLYNELHPTEPPRKFSIPVRFPSDTPKGRQPKERGLGDLERNVRWYYRHKVKGESIHDLAREYASWANRDNDCRSVVQGGIDQVQAILDLMTARAIRPT